MNFDPEEFVISVYGGDEKSAMKILQQYEVIGTPNREGDRVQWMMQAEIECVIDGPVWINCVGCSVPHESPFGKEIRMPVSLLPFFVTKNNTMTLRVGPALIHWDVKPGLLR